MIIHANQQRRLSIHLSEFDSEPLREMAQRSEGETRHRLWPMQGAGCGSTCLPPAIGPYRDIGGQQSGQSHKIALFDRLQELPQEVLVLLGRGCEARMLGGKKL